MNDDVGCFAGYLEMVRTCVPIHTSMNTTYYTVHSNYQYCHKHWSAHVRNTEPAVIQLVTALFVLQVYFGTQHARAYLIASLLGVNCANGMSWLVRKKALEEVGGLRSFTDYLAEDFFMGKALWMK